jgi:DNA-directed RNA polymerase sigma subunit (sigma70/sigma32)
MARTPKKKVFETYSNDFYWLATEISHILAKNKEDGTTQQQQVEELFLAERLFKEEILKYKYSTQCFKKFIQKIRHIDRNILYAKVYFRESSETFSAKITPFLKSEDPEGLKAFKINYNLILFIKNNWRGPLGVKAEKLYKRVERARRILIEQNLPLIVNVSKLFFRKVPKSQITLMDMIAVSAMGLASAVDKYTGDKNGQYSRVFLSVAMGRATGNLIKLYSETPLHFYPSDRKILYKANSIRGRQGIKDVTELAAAINTAFAADAKEGLVVPKDQVTPAQLQELLNAATLVSVELTAKDDEDGSFNAYDFTPDDKASAEENLIQTETHDTISKLISELPPLYRKVLKLRGVNF